MQSPAPSALLRTRAGTGAIRAQALLNDFRLPAPNATVFVSKPDMAETTCDSSSIGMEMVPYRYFDGRTPGGVDFDGHIRRPSRTRKRPIVSCCTVAPTTRPVPT